MFTIENPICLKNF